MSSRTKEGQNVAVVQENSGSNRHTRTTRVVITLRYHVEETQCERTENIRTKHSSKKCVQFLNQAAIYFRFVCEPGCRSQDLHSRFSDSHMIPNDKEK